MAATVWVIEVLNWAPDGWEQVRGSPQYTDRIGAEAYIASAKAHGDNRTYRAVQVPLERPGLEKT